jgi:hypothetical protein
VVAVPPTAFDVGLPGSLPSGIGFVVISKYTGGDARPAGVPQPVVNSAVRTAVVGTQRRRLGDRLV